MSKPPAKAKTASRLSDIWAAAETYGGRSFENYAQIRSVAETVRDEFCQWLSVETGPCVFLVPPEGPFRAENYQSAAFSVAGQGYLPLKPISFGLAVRISEDKDYMRLQLHCRKEGAVMHVSIGEKRAIKLPLPVTLEGLEPLFERMHHHILHFFQDSVDEYDNGNYGNPGIGFDIFRVPE
jgi:hypothetical protein